MRIGSETVFKVYAEGGIWSRVNRTKVNAIKGTKVETPEGIGIFESVVGDYCDVKIKNVRRRIPMETIEPINAAEHLNRDLHTTTQQVEAIRKSQHEELVMHKDYLGDVDDEKSLNPFGTQVKGRVTTVVMGRKKAITIVS